MERADRSPLRPGPSLAAVLALSATVLVVPVTAPPAPGTPPSAADNPAVPDGTVPDGTVPDGTAGWPNATAPEAVVPLPISRVSPGGSAATGPYSGLAGIPASVYPAYTRAAAHFATTQPDCGLPSVLLAAIGRVESGHARGGRVDSRGTTLTPILGPRLDGGPALAAIPDTDGGGYDGDTVWDRAVGPMQFIPGTWRGWAADGNGDGVADPHNVHDAARAAGAYLCADGRDLSTEQGLRAGVLSYNRSESYLHLIRRWMAVYERGVVIGPVGPAGPSAPEAGAGSPGSATGTPVTAPAPRPATPPATRPGPPEPAPTTPATPPPSPSPSPSPDPAGPVTTTVTDVVAGTLCLVDGIVVSVTTTTTSLLGGLLGQPVSPGPAEGCPRAS
ncbi:lytic transglycosylase domain-containing protein [Actinophytocola algeriensis]|uniref:Transglycosylase SLT domain-containing protein n=1 Tax=Actinophytocola algeriensis TaxID=1768010 RepID=A0A7W7VEI6_9PSEU|nr:lytic transglycosylase domain-containing protein [Actinophytocola algeriensis]MBB4907050.1 hypothetical protein [Actinophytocola algeriensis]MBE1478533.1 hypothetical protein [Actinophytocola algeriensis]